jgi:uncharacterized protein
MMDLRDMREAAGLTQDDVCARTGIARPNLSAYENGRRLPSPETLTRIRHACRVRPSVALARHHERVLEIVRAHHGITAEVFGSVARGDDRWDSDLDLLITLDRDAGYFDLTRMQTDLEVALNVSVDLVSKNAVTRSAESDVDARILRDARSIESVNVT